MPEGVGAGVGHPAEVIDGPVQFAGLEVGAGGAPETQIDNRADVALLQKFFPV